MRELPHEAYNHKATAMVGFLWWLASAAVVHGLGVGPLQSSFPEESSQLSPFLRHASDSKRAKFLANVPAPTKPLVCFQVATPVLSNAGALTGGSAPLDVPAHPDVPFYQVQLMDHHFAFSYTHPFVGKHMRQPSSGLLEIMVGVLIDASQV